MITQSFIALSGKWISGYLTVDLKSPVPWVGERQLPEFEMCNEFVSPGRWSFLTVCSSHLPCTCSSPHCVTFCRKTKSVQGNA